MKGRGWAAVLAVTAASCQCLTPVDEGDAGAGAPPHDGGRAADAGFAARDSGVFDAGGERDASVAFDAGDSVRDAGEHHADASVSIDSGVDVFDAGAPPELCDGIDNDFDGSIDRLIDGGVLTEACPLQSGVCAGSVARCINGAFTQCEYGTDYQRVENRCDGLDNDCDGRVDKSWPKILFRADAGSEQRGWLSWIDVVDPKVFPLASGRLMLGFAEQFLWLSPELETENRVRFPSVQFGFSSVWRDGDGWARVGAQQRSGGPRTSVWYTVHRVEADGGYEREANGSPRILAELDYQLFDGPVNIQGVLTTDAGWVVAPYFHEFSNGRRKYIYLNRDGSSAMHTIDASVPEYEEVVASGSSFFTSGPQCRVTRCELDESCVEYQVSDAGLDYCWLATTNPLVADVGFFPPTKWVDGWGNQLGYDTDYVRRNTYASRTHGVRLISDGGGTTHADFGVISSGQWVNYERVSSNKQTAWNSVTGHLSRFLPIDERLGLFVFAEGPVPPGGICPACAIGDLSAEYICLP